WAAPAAGGVNTATVYYNEANVATKPASGQTYTFTPPAPCAAPPDQASGLVLFPGAGGVGGTLTNAASAPTGYLVVRTNSPAAPSSPVNGTTYTVGSSALGGVIISNSSANAFLAQGLNQSTTYY